MVLRCFFFQAEDGIRDRTVTGVQTCALGLASTTDAHAHELTRRNIGTCAVLRYPYIVATRLGGKGRDLVSQLRLQDGSERKFRGGRRCKQGLRRPAIREEPLRLG